MLGQSPWPRSRSVFVASWLADLPDLSPALLLRHPKQLGGPARGTGQGLRAQQGTKPLAQPFSPN